MSSRLAASLVPFLSPGSPALADPSLLDRAARHKCVHPDCLAHAIFPQSGSSARWITPSNVPGFVICPTCVYPVRLADWWSHGCRMVPNARPRRRPVPRRGPRQYWQGDEPTTCNVCQAPIRNGFGDAPLPGRSTWGIYCGLCWTLESPDGIGQYYERTRAGKWIKVEG